jgi:ribosomal protein S18 acetylase RimI-like enzyme
MAAAMSAPAPHMTALLTLRATAPSDAPAIRAMTQDVGVFSAEEIATVDELLDAYFTQGGEVSGYHFVSACCGAEVVGFACYGPRALTQGVYDLFWIVTAPQAGRQGVGGRLLTEVEAHIAARQGRMIIAETSGRAVYASTRAFYCKYGYTQDATIADFYAPDDDLVIFVRRLAIPPSP